MTMQPIAERRAHQRRKILVKMELQLPDDSSGIDPQSPAEPVKRCAFSRNVSVSGALVLSPDPLPAGTNLRVLIPFHDSNTTISLAGEVTRCIETEAGHEIAMKFLDPDPNAVELIEQYVLAE